MKLEIPRFHFVLNSTFGRATAAAAAERRTPAEERKTRLDARAVPPGVMLNFVLVTFNLILC